jgi:hypothetical protein
MSKMVIKKGNTERAYLPGPDRGKISLQAQSPPYLKKDACILDQCKQWEAHAVLATRTGPGLLLVGNDGLFARIVSAVYDGEK